MEPPRPLASVARPGRPAGEVAAVVRTARPLAAALGPRQQGALAVVTVPTMRAAENGESSCLDLELASFVRALRTAGDVSLRGTTPLGQASAPRARARAPPLSVGAPRQAPRARAEPWARGNVLRLATSTSAVGTRVAKTVAFPRVPVPNLQTVRRTSPGTPRGAPEHPRRQVAATTRLILAPLRPTP